MEPKKKSRSKFREKKSFVFADRFSYRFIGGAWRF
jgi:hypothetical protein